MLANYWNMRSLMENPSNQVFGRYLRHPFSGVGLAFKHGVPEEVMHVIATHSKRG